MPSPFRYVTASPERTGQNSPCQANKTAQLLTSPCVSGPDVPAASREAPQCTSSSQLTGTGTPVTQWACMLPAMMPVGCNSVSLIGTSVGVISAGPGDLQAKNLTRCRSPHAPCSSLRIRNTTDSPLKSRNAQATCLPRQGPAFRCTGLLLLRIFPRSRSMREATYITTSRAVFKPGIMSKPP